MIDKGKCIKETEIALIQNNQLVMTNRLTGIEQGIDKIINKMDGFNDTFVTKKEHEIAHSANEKKIEKIENILGKINWIIISSVILGLLALIIKMS